jgi:vancomycin resistance protein YoaR
MALVATVGALVVAFFSWPRPQPVVEPRPLPGLRVAGHDVPLGDDAIGRALDYVRRFAVGQVKLVLPDGRSVALGRAELGLEIDRMRLAEFVKDASDPDSALVRAHRAGPSPGKPIEAPLPLRIDGARALSKLVDLKAELDEPAQDAMIDVESRKVKPEVRGFRLDVYATLARLEDALRAGSTDVPAAFEDIAPKRTSAELANVRFDHVLGWFETRYNVARKYEDRTYNLRLAASRLDGRVLLPGEVLDFNAVVGPRDEAHGFRVAPVIAQGELVDGIGGGTCQISGTLHAAALFAGLEIVERYPHSRPSSYIKLGLDATVSYPNINYRVRNPFDFPVVLHEKVAGGVVRAEVLGPERRLTVSYFRRIDDILPFEEVERETANLPKGDRVVVQRGIPGFVALASRVVRDGAYGDRWKWTEKYPPTTQIVAVGTSEGDAEPKGDGKAKVVEDTHPEYTVDEVLVITQGPLVRGEGPPGGAMSETRVTGRTGEAGWIAKLGFEKTPIGKGEDSNDASPTDAEKKSGEKSAQDKSANDKTSGDKKSGDKKAADRKGADSKGTDNKSGGDKKATDKKSGDKKGTDAKSGDKKGAKKPAKSAPAR